MLPFLYVTLGSALGGLLRYTVARLTLPLNATLPVGTLLINITGSLVIGYFGTLTLQGSRYAASENMRLFVMVGLCGGFTTFSSFSLETFELFRSGAYLRALVNAVLSVTLCVAAVAAGHLLAQHSTHRTEIAQTVDEEFSG